MALIAGFRACLMAVRLRESGCSLKGRINVTANRKRAKRATALRVFLFANRSALRPPGGCHLLRWRRRSSSATIWKFLTNAALDGGSKYFSGLDAHDLIRLRWG